MVHCDLKPANVVFFSATLSWKLVDLATACRHGARMPLSRTLRCAGLRAALALGGDRTDGALCEGKTGRRPRRGHLEKNELTLRGAWRRASQVLRPGGD